MNRKEPEVHGPFLVDEDVQIVLGELENLEAVDGSIEVAVDRYAKKICGTINNPQYLVSLLERIRKAVSAAGAKEAFSGDAWYRTGLMTAQILKSNPELIEESMRENS